MRRAWVAVVLGLLVLPACSGGGDDASSDEVVPPDQWAGTVCTTVGEAAGRLQRALRVINDLPDDVQADAPLGDQARPVRNAFLALPDYVDRFQAVVEDTPAPDTPDGAAFREEVLADLDSASTTFNEVALAAEAIDSDTTVEEFFGGAQAFAGFPDALEASDLDFGDDLPPGIAAALAADQTCVDVQHQLETLIA